MYIFDQVNTTEQLPANYTGILTHILHMEVLTECYGERIRVIVIVSVTGLFSTGIHAGVFVSLSLTVTFHTRFAVDHLMTNSCIVST